ncbi:hypothetical protein QOZ80_6BG0485700 [Eleusine coracana subsp. coracana]|nr:hypothetical protein QOZ80_6BG0485700 [Eleusine coracana subsp. coracana]
MKYFRCLGVFLGCRYNVISMCGFKVTCVLSDQAAGMEDGVNIVTTRVYYHHAPPYPTSRVKNGWGVSREAIKKSIIHLRGAESAHFAGRTRGITFWGIEEDGTVLSIEENTVYVYTDPVKMQVVSLIGDELRVFAKRKHGDGTTEWLHENSVCLPEATHGLPGHKQCYFSSTAKIVAAGKGYVVLTPAEETWLFSVEVRTMKVERELKQVLDRLAGEVYPHDKLVIVRVVSLIGIELRVFAKRKHDDITMESVLEQSM